MRVEIYRNLHNGKLSVRDRKTRHVIAHVDSITLAGVQMIVSQAGRERVLREKRKNVHAFLTGKVIAFNGATAYKGRNLDSYLWKAGSRSLLVGDGRTATYNPYKFDSFVIPQENNRPITYADMCHVDSTGIHLGDSNIRGEKWQLK